MGIIGLVQQLCEESPRQLLGCEGVLEDGRSWFLASVPASQASGPLLHPPASHLQKLLCCRSLLGILGQGKLEESDGNSGS